MVAIARNFVNTKYQRRRPDQEIVFRTVQRYWPVFLNEQRKVGKSFPLFIQDEFSKYLECGIVENGFVRTYCYQCRHSGIVAFSCKRRGFCPSCCAKRMNLEAAFLADWVLPEIPYRQWVLSFPYKLRFLMAHNQAYVNTAIRIFTNAICSYQKRKSKKSGISKCFTGSVTFVQRFGSALNLNIHFHSLIPDGVFFDTENGFEFYRQAQPTKAELLQITQKIHKKLLKTIEKRGLFEDLQVSFDEAGLDEISALSIANKSGFGERAGKGIRRFGNKKIEIEPEIEPSSVNVEGFSLNAQVWVAAKNQKKLEQLLRYMARGPIATERLSECPLGSLQYKMKTPWKDGTSHVSFSPLDFIARLVALIPPPRMNMIRYHGVFAPNFKGRRSIVKKSKAKGDKTPIAEKAQPARLSWAEMLKRVFEIDVTVCPKCSGRMEQIAVIRDKAVAKTILESLGEHSGSRGGEQAQARGPPADEWIQENFDQRDSTW
jgi:hypothetical protein